MTNLSVNINKVATLRNARGGNMPDVLKVAQDAEAFGAQGITVHPRPDERHIRYKDVYALRNSFSILVCAVLEADTFIFISVFVLASTCSSVDMLFLSSLSCILHLF